MHTKSQTGRSAPRVDLIVPVVLWDEDPEVSFMAYSVNLSRTGMLVLSDETRPRGTVLHFEATPELKGRCEVIWTRESRSEGIFLGMKFRSLRRRARKELAELTVPGGG